MKWWGAIACLVVLAACCRSTQAQDAPPLTPVVTVGDWLTSLRAESDTPTSAADVSIEPTDLPAIVDAWKSSNDTVRWRISQSMRGCLESIAGQVDKERSAAWTTSLIDQVTSMAAPATPDFEFSIDPPRSVLEIAMETAQQVAAIPEPALDLEVVASTRTELIRLLGLVISPLDWPRLEPFYAEPGLRRAVLEAGALARGSAFRSFIETRLLSSDESELVELIPVLVAAYPEDGARALMDLARSTTHGNVFWACLEPLSERGVLPADITQARSDWSTEESRRFVELTLRAAHALAAQGNCDKARRVFSSVVEQNISSQAVRSALTGMAACGDSRLYRAALGYINDPSLRSPIIKLLVTSLDRESEQQLQGAWASMPPLTQAALLQVFHERDPEGAGSLLASAATSPYAAVRYAAALLRGEAPDEDDLWELAGSPPDWLQQEALRSYLALADARVARGEMEQARLQYLALLQGGLPNEVERQAVAGLGRAGNPDDKAILDQLAEEHGLRGVGERARVTLAGRSTDPMAKAEAVGQLTARDVPQEELEQLLAGVEEPKARALLLARAGFVGAMRAIGPFPVYPGMILAQLHFPIVPYPLVDDVNFEGKSLTWRDLATCEEGLRFDLTQCMEEVQPEPVGQSIENAPLAPADVPVETNAQESSADRCAYLSAEIRLPRIAGVFLHVYHDDGFALWINGQFQREAAPVEDIDGEWRRFPVVLEPGLSYVVIKLPQHRDTWKGGLRVTSRDGKPFDLTQQAMPEDKFKPVGVEAIKAKKQLEQSL